MTAGVYRLLLGLLGLRSSSVPLVSVALQHLLLGLSLQCFGGVGSSQGCSGCSVALYAIRKRTHRLERVLVGFGWFMVEEASSYSGICGPKWNNFHT